MKPILWNLFLVGVLLISLSIGTSKLSEPLTMVELADYSPAIDISGNSFKKIPRSTISPFSWPTSSMTPASTTYPSSTTVPSWATSTSSPVPTTEAPITSPATTVDAPTTSPVLTTGVPSSYTSPIM